MKRFDKILQEALIKNNVLDADELARYAQNALDDGVSLKVFLLRNALVKEKQILIALSQLLNLEMVRFDESEIPLSLVEQIPVKFVWYYKFMPIALEKNVLTIACANPLDVKVCDEIRMHLGFSIKVALAEERPLMDAIKKYYGLAADTIEKIMNKEGDSPLSLPQAGSVDWIEDLEAQSEDPTVANLVNQIILEAFTKRATDIHIEPYRNKVRFRYRIDGVLIDANLPDNVRHFLAPILSRIKILANLSITERRLPQDGSAVVKTRDQKLDLRVSTMPTPRGESIVIRLLPTHVTFLNLDKLGCNPTSVEIIRRLILQPHGIIFMTGPTGSGKSTTLYACLKEIDSNERKIITIEDPIEYEMDGITQVQVNTKVNFDFSTGLRSLLRHDPDVMMVGEVRDLETAEIAVRTALTGHLVFSTLHTNDAASGVTRLIDMGVEPYLVASSVQAFIGQRLVRLICPRCKEEDLQAGEAIRCEIARSLDLKNGDSIKIYRGRGCDECNKTGYLGRIAIYEVLKMSDNVRSAILEKPRSDYIKRIAIAEGMATLRQNGWRAVLEGITTPQEVINVTVHDADVGSAPVAASRPSNPLPDGPKEKGPVFVKFGDIRKIHVKGRDQWMTEEEYESRAYSRTYEPVHIRYQPLKSDPANNDVLISEGIEYSTITQDISAGGLRFMTKMIYPIGTLLELRIHLTDIKRSVKCLAKVCRVETDSLDNVYAVVNYFLDMSSADRNAINKFVENSRKKTQEFEENSMDP